MICLFCKRILRLVSIDVIIVFDLEVLSENTKNIFNMVLSTIITSVLWSGHRGITYGYIFDKFVVEIRYTRLEGEWPDEMANENFPVSVQVYTCVRGEDW